MFWVISIGDSSSHPKLIHDSSVKKELQLQAPNLLQHPTSHPSQPSQLTKPKPKRKPKIPKTQTQNPKNSNQSANPKSQKLKPKNPNSNPPNSPTIESLDHIALGAARLHSFRQLLQHGHHHLKGLQGETERKKTAVTSAWALAPTLKNSTRKQRKWKKTLLQTLSPPKPPNPFSRHPKPPKPPQNPAHRHLRAKLLHGSLHNVGLQRIGKAEAQLDATPEALRWEKERTKQPQTKDPT